MGGAVEDIKLYIAEWCGNYKCLIETTMIKELSVLLSLRCALTMFYYSPKRWKFFKEKKQWFICCSRNEVTTEDSLNIAVALWLYFLTCIAVPVKEISIWPFLFTNFLYF